jgi:hypothetical protein
MACIGFFDAGGRYCPAPKCKRLKSLRIGRSTGGSQRKRSQRRCRQCTRSQPRGCEDKTKALLQKNEPRLSRITRKFRRKLPKNNPVSPQGIDYWHLAHLTRDVPVGNMQNFVGAKEVEACCGTLPAGDES